VGICCIKVNGDSFSGEVVCFVVIVWMIGENNGKGKSRSPSGMTSKRGKDNGNCRFLRFAEE
jgi:hypothetical protein